MADIKLTDPTTGNTVTVSEQEAQKIISGESYVMPSAKEDILKQIKQQQERAVFITPIGPSGERGPSQVSTFTQAGRFQELPKEEAEALSEIERDIIKSGGSVSEYDLSVQREPSRIIVGAEPRQGTQDGFDEQTKRILGGEDIIVSKGLAEKASGIPYGTLEEGDYILPVKETRQALEERISQRKQLEVIFGPAVSELEKEFGALSEIQREEAALGLAERRDLDVLKIFQTSQASPIKGIKYPIVKPKSAKDIRNIITGEDIKAAETLTGIREKKRGLRPVEEALTRGEPEKTGNFFQDLFLGGPIKATRDIIRMPLVAGERSAQTAAGEIESFRKIPLKENIRARGLLNAVDNAVYGVVKEEGKKRLVEERGFERVRLRTGAEFLRPAMKEPITIEQLKEEKRRSIEFARSIPERGMEIGEQLPYLLPFVPKLGRGTGKALGRLPPKGGYTGPTITGPRLQMELEKARLRTPPSLLPRKSAAFLDVAPSGEMASGVKIGRTKITGQEIFPYADVSGVAFQTGGQGFTRTFGTAAGPIKDITIARKPRTKGFAFIDVYQESLRVPKGSVDISYATPTAATRRGRVSAGILDRIGVAQKIRKAELPPMLNIIGGQRQAISLEGGRYYSTKGFSRLITGRDTIISPDIGIATSGKPKKAMGIAIPPDLPKARIFLEGETVRAEALSRAADVPLKRVIGTARADLTVLRKIRPATIRLPAPRMRPRPMRPFEYPKQKITTAEDIAREVASGAESAARLISPKPSPKYILAEPSLIAETEYGIKSSAPGVVGSRILREQGGFASPVMTIRDKRDIGIVVGGALKKRRVVNVSQIQRRQQELGIRPLVMPTTAQEVGIDSIIEGRRERIFRPAFDTMQEQRQGQRQRTVQRTKTGTRVIPVTTSIKFPFPEMTPTRVREVPRIVDFPEFRQPEQKKRKRLYDEIIFKRDLPIPDLLTVIVGRRTKRGRR